MQLSSHLRQALRSRRPCCLPFVTDARHRQFSSARPAAATAAGDARDAAPRPMMPTRPWGEALAAAQLCFCLPLVGRILAASATGNAAVSPAAVHASLALAAAGARGATRRQVIQALCGGGGGGRGAAADAANVASRAVKRVLRDRSTSGGPRLAFAAGIWAGASTNLSAEFVEAAGNVYGAAAKTADFVNKVGNSSYKCNSWICSSSA
jgi:serpin B